MIRTSLSRASYEHNGLSTIYSLLQSNEPLDQPIQPKLPILTPEEDKINSKVPSLTDPDLLSSVWDISRICTDADWWEWMQR